MGTPLLPRTAAVPTAEAAPGSAVRRSWTSADLAELAEGYADRVRAGEFEVTADPAQRWHVRLHADAEVDVWLISWTQDQGTELHDHGGSAGAFTVVRGELVETSWESTRAAEHGPSPTHGLRDHRRSAGETSTFGPHYIHDVRNTERPVAVSVHVYSPPLSLMTYYDVDGDRVAPRAAQWTDDPEAPSPARAAS